MTLVLPGVDRSPFLPVFPMPAQDAPLLADRRVMGLHSTSPVRQLSAGQRRPLAVAPRQLSEQAPPVGDAKPQHDPDQDRLLFWSQRSPHDRCDSLELVSPQ